MMSFSASSQRSPSVPAVLLLVSLYFTACTGATPFSSSDNPPLLTPGSLPTFTRTPFQPLPPTLATILASEAPAIPVTPTPNTPTGALVTIWVAPYLPTALQESLTLADNFTLVDAPGQASLRLEVGDEHRVSQWVFALVSPFPTIPDGLSVQALKRSWRGELAGPFSGEPLLVDDSTYGVFSAWWGEPAPKATRVVPANELVDYAWDHQPSWALVPFEALQPRWKVLEVDGQSPLRKEFDLASYPLSVPISLNGDANLIEAAVSPETGENAAAWGLPASNRDADRLTTVALTGVTAMVRATAFSMHRKGVTYPALDIGELLRDADLTHISNEIPFTPKCPPPNPTQAGLVFCSDPEYIGLLEEVGTDIVELTGDHFGDWGPEAMYYTLDMYKVRDWIYYGGGSDRKDARQARLIEHNGNRLAFIGCNAKGGGYATASETQPGAVACDFDWMTQEIARLREEGYLVIATFQHFEYYIYRAQPDQVEDFRSMAKAGAVIVSGSQAHQPQGMEFFKGAFIHYGLGNLFFDQYHYCTDNACDDAFIDRHVFYDGRYIGTDLITIVFEDYARSRPMTEEERMRLLETVFAASGW